MWFNRICAVLMRQSSSYGHQAPNSPMQRTAKGARAPAGRRSEEMTLAVEPGVAPPTARQQSSSVPPSAFRGWPARRSAYVFAATWYLAFIVRASFTLDGRRAFGLFDDGMISLTYARNLAS